MPNKRQGQPESDCFAVSGGGDCGCGRDCGCDLVVVVVVVVVIVVVMVVVVFVVVATVCTPIVSLKICAVLIQVY